MAKAIDLELGCACGVVGGVARGLAPRTISRLVCMCDDCQTFVRALERPDLLDEHGGVEVVQLAPARLSLTRGQAELACLRLSPKGLLRFHTRCCRTPVANVIPRPGVPFAAVSAGFVVRPDLDVALGPVRARVNGRFCQGKLPPGAHRSVSVGLLLRTARILAGQALRRSHRPSPFFSARDGEPVVVPVILDRARRSAIRDEVHAGHVDG